MSMQYGTIPAHNCSPAPAWGQQKNDDPSCDDKTNNQAERTTVLRGHLSLHLLKMPTLACLVVGVAATALFMISGFVFSSRLPIKTAVPYLGESTPVACAGTKPEFSGRHVVSSGTIFEELYGYSRAVRSGDIIHVSGTIAIGPDGELIGRDDAAVQAEYIFGKIRSAIHDLGGRMEDVVRTRVYVSSRDYALDVAQVHGKVFQTIRPANTLVLAELIEEEYMVEIEAEAVVGSSTPLHDTSK